MVTTEKATPEDDEPTVVERVEAAGRSVIAGHPSGSVRRIGLYVIIALALGAAGNSGLALVLSLLGLAALLLLAATDELA